MDLFYCSNIFYCSNTYYTDLCSCQLCFHLLYLLLSVGQSAQFFELVDVQDFPAFFGGKGQDIKLIFSSCVFGIFREHLSHKSSAIVYSHLFLFPVFKWIFDKRVTTILHFLYAPLPAGVFAEFNVVFICIEWPTAQSVRVIDLLNLQIKFTLFPLFQLSCLF